MPPFRYDHLATVLKDILSRRIADAGDIFERLSEIAKSEKYTSNLSTIGEYSDASLEVALAEIQKLLFSVSHDFPSNLLCFFRFNVVMHATLKLHAYEGLHA